MCSGDTEARAAYGESTARDRDANMHAYKGTIHSPFKARRYRLTTGQAALSRAMGAPIVIKGFLNICKAQDNSVIFVFDIGSPYVAQAGLELAILLP